MVVAHDVAAFSQPEGYGCPRLREIRKLASSTADKLPKVEFGRRGGDIRHCRDGAKERVRETRPRRNSTRDSRGVSIWTDRSRHVHSSRPKSPLLEFGSNGVDALRMDGGAVVNAEAGVFNILSTQGWSLDYLLALGKRFRAVPRVSAFDPALNARLDEFDRTAEPLVIESYHLHGHWPRDAFTVDYFRETLEQSSKRAPT